MYSTYMYTHAYVHMYTRIYAHITTLDKTTETVQVQVALKSRDLI